jgi:hypothetical protein
VGNVILGLPAKTRQHYLALPNKLGEQAINGHIDSGVRNRVLRLGVFLGRLAEVTNKPDYGKAGLKILKAGLDQLSIKTSALEFSSLGEAAALFREDDTVMKLFVLAEARTLQNMQEDGALWQDSTLTVLNLYGLEAPKRRAALREFVKTAGPKPTLPPTVKLMTQEELRAIFPERPRAELLQLQIQLVNLIFDRGKQNIPFSLDMLRYGVNEAGAYANGSPVAQGGFLLSYKKLPWRYGGNTWPGSEEARKPR